MIPYLNSPAIAADEASCPIAATVLLGGSVRPTPFSTAIQRSLLDLPVARGRSLLGQWRQHVAALPSPLPAAPSLTPASQVPPSALPSPPSPPPAPARPYRPGCDRPERLCTLFRRYGSDRSRSHRLARHRRPAPRYRHRLRGRRLHSRRQCRPDSRAPFAGAFCPAGRPPRRCRHDRPPGRHPRDPHAHPLRLS